MQVSGADYMVDSAGAKLKLSGYKAGDKVRIVGKISLTKKKCAEDGATADERYGKPSLNPRECPRRPTPGTGGPGHPRS